MVRASVYLTQPFNSIEKGMVAGGRPVTYEDVLRGKSNFRKCLPLQDKLKNNSITKDPNTFCLSIDMNHIMDSTNSNKAKTVKVKDLFQVYQPGKSFQAFQVSWLLCINSKINSEIK